MKERIKRLNRGKLEKKTIKNENIKCKKVIERKKEKQREKKGASYESM